ncbi:MAG: alanine racemase [Clostridia bacterium]
MSRLFNCYAEIDLNNLTHNYKRCLESLGESKIMAVVKANAYGHGAPEVAKHLNTLGCNNFAVAELREAIELRKKGIEGNILILGYTPTELVSELISFNLTQTVYCNEYLDKLNLSAKINGNKKVKAHIELDTGMRRVGFESDYESVLKLCIQLKKSKYIDTTGIFTHLSSADSFLQSDTSFTKKQLSIFDRAVEQIKREYKKDLTIHSCNSAGSLFYNNQYDMARIGIALYGLTPCALLSEKLSLRAVMRLYARISMVKTIKSGEYVSYNRTFCADSDIKLATVSIGYADGYPRSQSNCGVMSIKGRQAKVVGRVTMEQTIIDVTGIDCNIGDIVTVFGENGLLSAETVAKTSNTINYEIVSRLSKDIPRIFIYK